MEKVDKLDRQILNIISKNARIPFKEVAEDCGVSRAAIHQRVQRMSDMNVITGSGYHINPKALGYNTCTYIGVKLERGSMYKDVVPEFEKIPEVVECHFTTGPYTLLIDPACRITVKCILGKDTEVEINKIPLSNNTIYIQFLESLLSA